MQKVGRQLQAQYVIEGSSHRFPAPDNARRSAPIACAAVRPLWVRRNLLRRTAGHWGHRQPIATFLLTCGSPPIAKAAHAGRALQLRRTSFPRVPILSNLSGVPFLQLSGRRIEHPGPLFARPSGTPHVQPFVPRAKPRVSPLRVGPVRRVQLFRPPAPFWRLRARQCSFTATLAARRVATAGSSDAARNFSNVAFFAAAASLRRC
jgi:hypothetical protein